jgi:hypothetical protein
MQLSEVTSAKRVLAEVLSDLRFVPVAEAELPAGFPSFTPVGVLEVKDYPSYRKASGPGFWTLFLHIQTNRIAMTTPVEMSFERDAQGKLKESKMAFLYGNAALGKPGKRGRVTVADHESTRVVSLGVRGDRSSRVLQDADARLQRWFSTHPEYRAAGKIRLMGYNSPYVPRARQFFEVQIPVQVRTSEQAPN